VVLFLGGLFSSYEFDTHFAGAKDQLPESSLAVAFLVVILTLVGVFLARGEHRASLSYLSEHSHAVAVCFCALLQQFIALLELLLASLSLF